MSRENNNHSAIGIDIGTSRIVVARRLDGEDHFESQLNAFLTVPFNKLAAATLDKEKVPHKIADGTIVVYGNESEKLADLFSGETRRPMLRGMLNPDEKESLDRIRDILGFLLGDTKKTNQRICFSVPAPALNGSDDLRYHETALRQVLQEFGSEVTSINEGLAVVFGELQNENFTGVGVSCGGGMCNVCLSYLAMPVFSFSTPKAGDFIDASTASVTGENATRIRVIKEKSFHLNGHYVDKIHRAICIYYDEMIANLANGIAESFARFKTIPKLDRPIPMVISGGSSMPEGFRERVEKAIAAVDVPVKFSEIRMASEPLHATARGALAAATAEL